MPSSKSTPVIDFSDFVSGDKQRMQHCADQIRDACLTQGFFQIVNHDIPASLQKDIFRVSKAIFALPLEEKMKLDKSLVCYLRHIYIVQIVMLSVKHRTNITGDTKSCMVR